VSGPAARVDAAFTERAVPQLQSAARAIAKELDEGR